MVKVQHIDSKEWHGYDSVFLGEKSIQKEKNPILDDLLTKCKEKDLKFDYLKSHQGFVFYVSDKQSDEELRIAGSKIRNLIDRETKSLLVFGTSHINPLIEGFLLTNYQFIHHFTKSETKKYALNAIYVDEKIEKETLKYLNKMQQALYWTRDLVNEPLSHLNASDLANRIKALEVVPNLKVKVLEKSQIETLKMGGLLAVNKGSIDPPTFTIMEYKPKKPSNKKPIVLVGKGVVYDTGGLSLKPTPGSMDCMKSDMAGAASVAGAIYLTALMALDVHVIGLIPATDNRPGLNAYTPGDIITMSDGTTVEVLNTDAEGRMILADALVYANKYEPELIISSATLTGAALRAIGTNAAIAMGDASDKTFKLLEKSGQSTHERIVQFPFWDEYLEPMKSNIADLKNIGGANAGMITAAKFLGHFVKHPYIHLDIAGPAWLDAKENYKGQGGTGFGVRLLYSFLENAHHGKR